VYEVHDRLKGHAPMHNVEVPERAGLARVAPPATHTLLSTDPYLI